MSQHTAALVLPNFLICGAQKSGTTALYFLLQQHPQVGLSPVKEIRFFIEDRYYEKGLEWYAQHFASLQNKRAIGEATPQYYCSAKARQRILRDLPGVRCIFILRDPVERAYSNYWKEISYGHKITLSFLEALEVDPMIIERSLYWKHLHCWFAQMKDENILVVLREELKDDSQQLLNKVWDFLEVDRYNLDSNHYQRQYNAGVAPKSKMVRYAHGLYARMYKLFPQSLRNYLRKRIKPKLYSEGYPPLDPEVRQYLIEKYFRDDILRLQDLLQRDLSHWLI